MNPNIARLLITLGTSLIIASPLLLPQVRALLRQQAVQTFTNRPELEKHLAALQSRIANLLLACEHLLDGETPQDTIMYRLIEAYGGIKDPVRKLRIEEWLGRSQLALANVFAIRNSLLDLEIQAQRPLDKLIKDWETLYVTIVGSAPRILELTDKDLHILLDPLEVLEREQPEDARLASQLMGIHDDLESRPLKINLRMINPQEYDPQGILGYIDLVEQEFAQLQADAVQAAKRAEQQEAHNEALERKARLTHIPQENNLHDYGRRLTISERIAAIQAQADDEE